MSLYVGEIGWQTTGMSRTTRLSCAVIHCTMLERPPFPIAREGLVELPVGVPMTDTWSEAHHHLDGGLKFFVVVNAAGTVFGMLYDDWLLASICLIAGCLAGVIGTSVNRSVVVTGPGEDDEFANETEVAEAHAFAHEFLEFSNLLAATTLTVGFALGLPWWSSLLVATLSWFVSLFGIPLLCAPGNK